MSYEDGRGGGNAMPLPENMVAEVVSRIPSGCSGGEGQARAPGLEGG